MANTRQQSLPKRTQLHMPKHHNSKRPTTNTKHIPRNLYKIQTNRTQNRQNPKNINPTTTTQRHNDRRTPKTTRRDTMKIQIDNREQSRIPIATKYYQTQGHEVTVEQLPVGDYIFNNKVVMEFKTFPDLLSSITDNRLFNETISQMENFDIHFLVIHGTNRDYHEALQYQGLEKKHLIGAKARVRTYSKIIRGTETITDTFEEMLVTAEKCLDNKTLCKGFGTKSVNKAFNVLAFCVDDINAERAKAIVNHLNLKTFKDVCNLTEKELLKVPGIGPVLAGKILDAIR